MNDVPKKPNHSPNTVNFLIPYALDYSIRNPETKRSGEPVIVIQKLASKGPNGEDCFGLLGGYASSDVSHDNSTTEEPPHQRGVRNIQAIINDKGNPVLSPEPQRLKLLHAANDFSKDAGGPCLAFGLELTVMELASIKTHSENLQNDPAYAAAVNKVNQREVLQIVVKPLREVLEMSKDQFPHPHEYDVIKEKIAHLPVENERNTTDFIGYGY